MSQTPDSEDSESAISPVVGVILMVGITVALAASVLVVVMGMSDTPSTSNYAAVDVKQSGYGLTVQLTDTSQKGPFLLKVNGKTVHKWENGQIGQTKSLQCLRPGDTVSLVSGGQDQQVLQEYEVERQTDCGFTVKQGNKTFTVAPINWKNNSQSGTQFYNYSNSHSHMNTISERNTSFMFFYVYEDSLSLVIVHDKPNDSHTPGSDEGGGVADMLFHNMPNGSWAEQDDGSDFDCDGNPNKVCWSWGETYTDGGVYSGSFSDDVNLTVENAWNENASRWGDGFPHDGGTLDKWQFLSRSGPNANVTRTNLTMGQNVTIIDK